MRKKFWSDQHHLAVAHDILLIAGVKLVGAQGLGDVMHDGRGFGLIKRLIRGQDTRVVQHLLQRLVALFGIGDGAGLFVQLVVLGRQQGDQLVNLLIQIAAVLTGARDD